MNHVSHLMTSDLHQKQGSAGHEVPSGFHGLCDRRNTRLTLNMRVDSRPCQGSPSPYRQNWNPWRRWPASDTRD